jgi:hypothetical protein
MGMIEDRGRQRSEVVDDVALDAQVALTRSNEKRSGVGRQEEQPNQSDELGRPVAPARRERGSQGRWA